MRPLLVKHLATYRENIDVGWLVIARMCVCVYPMQQCSQQEQIIMTIFRVKENPLKP